MEDLIDILGEVMMASIFIVPFIIIPIFWKYSDGSRGARIIKGLLLSAVIDILLFCMSMAICLRNGLGPV